MRRTLPRRGTPTATCCPDQLPIVLCSQPAAEMNQQPRPPQSPGTRRRPLTPPAPSVTVVRLTPAPCFMLAVTALACCALRQFRVHCACGCWHVVSLVVQALFRSTPQNRTTSCLSKYNTCHATPTLGCVRFQLLPDSRRSPSIFAQLGWLFPAKF